MTEEQQIAVLNDWLSRHKPLLFKVMNAYAFSEPDRQDLLQEIMIQVWRSIPNFRENSAVTTWLYRISLNTALKWSTKQQRYRDREREMPKVMILKQEEPIQDERLDWLYAEISQMDTIDRSLTLLMLDGFSYNEISDILGISTSNVGVKLHRIKQYLITKSKVYDDYED